MIDVTLQNFETEVVATSMATPVLVDFWAPWCGPCKSLGPILEKVEKEYDGRFKLVKINSDDEQELAQAFGVRSIPTVVLLMGGRPVDGFMGAIPEGQVKEFLDKHLPPAEEAQAEAATDEAAELAGEGDHDAALAKLQEALAVNPADNETRNRYVELLLTLGRTEEARRAWEPLAPLLTAGGSLAARPAALEVWLNAQEHGKSARGVQELEAAIAADRRDFTARFALAEHWLVAGEQTRALDELLEIIMRDKSWNDSAARKAYVGILELLTPAQPSRAAESPKSAIALDRQVAALDPQQKLLADYRRKLSMALN